MMCSLKHLQWCTCQYCLMQLIILTQADQIVPYFGGLFPDEPLPENGFICLPERYVLSGLSPIIILCITCKIISFHHHKLCSSLWCVVIHSTKQIQIKSRPHFTSCVDLIHVVNLDQSGFTPVGVHLPPLCHKIWKHCCNRIQVYKYATPLYYSGQTNNGGILITFSFSHVVHLMTRFHFQRFLQVRQQLFLCRNDLIACFETYYTVQDSQRRTLGA